MTLRTPPDFRFRTAVCSHGFFVLAPNRWNPDRGELSTTIALNDRQAVPVSIRERDHDSIRLTAAGRLDRAEQAAVRQAIRRMLRLDEDLSDFHARCAADSSYHKAARIRFGRLLRGATLFEDIVKVICTCNVTWRQTVTMVERLVARWGVPADDTTRTFPTPTCLATASVKQLRDVARLGYRAEFVHRLARDVASGSIDLEAIEQFEGTGDELHKLLRTMHGIGPYAANNIAMLLGRYDRLAHDTELRRFLAQRHPRIRWTPARAQKHYDRWAPYQFLAYWFELWSDYVERHGEADQWWPEDIGREITAGRAKGR